MYRIGMNGYIVLRSDDSGRHFPPASLFRLGFISSIFFPSPNAEQGSTREESRCTQGLVCARHREAFSHSAAV